MDSLEKAARVLDLEIFELQRLRKRLDENFSRAVEVIKETVDSRGKVVVVGVGKSGHIGAKIASTLTSTGSPAVVLDSSNALHGDLGMIADGDVVLALSASGETEEMLRILPAITRFQVKIIAICGDPKSTLAQNAHVCLDVNVEQEACPLNLAPTSSTTVMLALGIRRLSGEAEFTHSVCKRNYLGRARVSRAGERVLAIANFSLTTLFLRCGPR